MIVCSNKEGFTIILKTSRRLTFCTVFYLVANFSKWLLFTFCWRLIKIVTATTKPWETYKRNCFSVFRCEKIKFLWPFLAGLASQRSSRKTLSCISFGTRDPFLIGHFYNSREKYKMIIKLPSKSDLA